MLGFTGGWKKKALTLRETLLCAGHQIAKELSPFIRTMLDLYREAVVTGDLTKLRALVETSEGNHDVPIWEPAHIYGWEIKATLYRDDGKLWWLVHALLRKSERSPAENAIVMLERVLDVLGCQPARDVVIGPRSPCTRDGSALPFGWWTWPNRHPLSEVQVNKHKRGQDVMRIVPLGTRPSDGYEHVDLSAKADLDDEAP